MEEEEAKKTQTAAERLNELFAKSLQLLNKARTLLEYNVFWDEEKCDLSDEIDKFLESINFTGERYKP